MNLIKFLSTCCSPIHVVIFSEHKGRWLGSLLAFFRGFALGQIYYYYMLKGIPFPYDSGNVIALTLSVIIGLLNVASIQVRCISLLTFPMYFGKAGRGVLKAVVLTYVVAGPITNMGLNAREVVRVFACSTELSYNLSRGSSDMLALPLRLAVTGLKVDLDAAADSFRYIKDVMAPIESEIEYHGGLRRSKELTERTDAMLGRANRSADIEGKYAPSPRDQLRDIYQKKYLMKSEYRCNNLLSRTVLRCSDDMKFLHELCAGGGVWPDALCAPLLRPGACDVPHVMRPGICDSRKQMDPGLGEGYVALKQAKTELMKSSNDINITEKTEENDAYNAQDAKETGDRVKEAFEKKFFIMQCVINVVNVCVALLFLRILVAAMVYHDMFLTSIEFDNIYVTEYFKRIDCSRRRRMQYTLLPLKKMERSRYVDVHALAYTAADRHRLVTQSLKVFLEVVTATTFVMLDRLFYEALDVVRQHAERGEGRGPEDLDVEVEGASILANTLRAMLTHLRAQAHRSTRGVSNVCLPQPSLMPAMFFVRIYGGYLWILLLLGANPYTMRLRRYSLSSGLISSYFYPRREKQRILHLYNDILKKRIKLDETLRRKAVQAIRAHYLSGESLLSARMRFPHMLRWLRVLPAARMACLICSEIEPRNRSSSWHTCFTWRCPFVYCGECWREVGSRCLACDPSLAELSDVDSLSEDELPKY